MGAERALENGFRILQSKIDFKNVMVVQICFVIGWPNWVQNVETEACIQAVEAFPEKYEWYEQF